MIVLPHPCTHKHRTIFFCAGVPRCMQCAIAGAALQMRTLH